MELFRKNEHGRLKELVVNSRNAIHKMEDYHVLGQRILRTAELCRKLETEREKVLPFYESTIPDESIPPELRPHFEGNLDPTPSSPTARAQGKGV